MQNWWKDANVVRQLVDWAYELNDAYGKSRVLSLGQSTAWIVQAVGMMRKLRGEPANIAFIPFTGAFLERGKNTDAGEMTFTDREGARPSPERVSRYFNLLGQLGAQPQQLAQTNKRVVIAEMIRLGNGLASFLDAWTGNEAHGDIPHIMKNVDLYTYDVFPQANLDAMRVKGLDYSFRLNRVPLNHAQGRLLEEIVPHNRVEESSSRLVPIYKLSAQTEDNGLELIPNYRNREEIRLALHREIQRREQETQHQESLAYEFA